jgi:dinuclear metal center YbgI/SA1388 family protein
MDLLHFVALLDDLLDTDGTPDFCPNGLQVEGRREVERVVTGVSACRALFTRAVDLDADLVLVHHGLLWRSEEPPRLVGSVRERLRLLLTHDISLVAYHLPLDRHPELGNAAQLARRLGLVELEPFGEFRGVSVGVCGVFPEPVPADELAEAVAAACEREPLHFPGSRALITSVGIVTGRAANDYHLAVTAGLDAFVTGEPSEWAMHMAAEEGVHFLAAGHHATERFGIVALGRWLAEHGLEVEFIDLPNPV